MDADQVNQFRHHLNNAIAAVTRALGFKVKGLRTAEDLDPHLESIKTAVHELGHAKEIAADTAQVLRDEVDTSSKTDAIKVRAHKRLKRKESQAAEEKAAGGGHVAGDQFASDQADEKG